MIIVVILSCAVSCLWNTEIFSLSGDTKPPLRVNHSEAFGHLWPVLIHLLSVKTIVAMELDHQ